jgi:hypothetical protein
MTQKVITSRFVVPTVSAIALAIVISIGAVYLINKYPLPPNQADAGRSAAAGGASAELPKADWRLWRVHVLLR